MPVHVVAAETKQGAKMTQLQITERSSDTIFNQSQSVSPVRAARAYG